MPRPARALAVSGAVVVGVLVGGTAYTASRGQSPDESIACVDLPTGAARSIDPPACTAAGDGPDRRTDIAGVRMADYVVTTTSKAMPPTTPSRPTRPAATTRPPAPAEPAVPSAQVDPAGLPSAPG